MPPTELAGAVAQLAAFLLVGWLAGHLLSAFALGTSDIGLPERVLLAIAGGALFSLALMVVHVASRGLVFGNRYVVPAVALATLWAGRRRLAWPRGVEGIPLLVFVVVLLALYFMPVLVGGTAARAGDPPWHLGWSAQVLAGEPVPTGPAPAELARNAYLWGFHAVTATMVRLVPGTDALIAHTALHLLILIGLPAAAASLARRVDVAAGWFGAAAATLVGGLGWIWARAPYFAASPRAARFGADLTVASPNGVYALFPPGVPRELALVLLAAVAVLLAAGTTRRSLVAAGIVAGAIGLISLPLFLAALMWMGATAILRRWSARDVAAALAPALALFALWAVPVAVDAVRFDGFVDITPRLGREWPLPVALASWGLLLPAALGGAWLALRAPERESAALLGFVAATTILLGLAVARGALGWRLVGNPSLLHQGRVWPVAHLLAAALAGVAARRAVVALQRRSVATAVGVGAAAACVGVASPVLASVEMARTIDREQAGFVYAGEDLAADGFVRRAAAVLGPDDAVRVDGSHELAFLLWQLSGCRLASYDDPTMEGNDLRIRFRALAEEWDRGARFSVDFVAVPEVLSDGEAEVTGEYRGERWVLIRDG